MTAGSGTTQPRHRPFDTIMNVFRDQSYHDEVVAYIHFPTVADKNNLRDIFSCGHYSHSQATNTKHMCSAVLLFNSSLIDKIS